MELKLEILGVLSVLELLIWIKPFWRWRRLTASILIIAISIATGQIVITQFRFWTVMILIFSLYRLINLLRLVERRLQVDYLFNTTRRASIWLIGLQIIVLGILAFSDNFNVEIINWLYLISGIQVIVAFVLLITTNRNIKSAEPPKEIKSISDRDLPTLTVAIPARNETEDLEECLSSLISSKYSKLEILVLDDCSQNKKTPEIIRSFAQAGVRFIAGQEPPESWLAKNYAYKQLADEANGEFILFCGVDARFTPDSLNKIVEVLVGFNSTMMCLMPDNIYPANEHLTPLLIQPSRYAWELALPRQLVNRPPILSTCWIASSNFINKSGGFDAVSRKIIPESYLARQADKTQKEYSFVLAENQIEVTTRKNFAEQRATAIRTRYPQLHKRVELVALLSLAEFAALILPLLIIIYAIVNGAWPLSIMSLIGWITANLLQSRIINLTYRKFIANGLWILSVASLFDIGLLNYSMWQYEFGEVSWKGRNVCIPFMSSIPSRFQDSVQK